MQTNEVKTKRVHNLIIVDESGSMEVIRKQAFVGMNETLQTVRQMQKKYPDQVQLVTLLTFDSGHTTWHYDNASALKTKDLSWKAYNPGGGTPLYDAIGKGISKVNAQIEDGDHVLVTIITDGEENSSEEWTLKMVRTMIEKLKKQGWTFTLIGTDNLDVETLPSTSIWSSSRARPAPRPCLPANAAAVNATTAVLPRMPPCLLVHFSKRRISKKFAAVTKCYSSCYTM